MKKTKIVLEDEISRTVMAENGCTAHFEYHEIITGKLNSSTFNKKVTVMTYNPKTQETFLLKEVEANTSEECLEKILEYVKSHKEEFDSFTIFWSKKGESKSEKSYFYCRDLFEALEKFYFNKNREEYTIYEVKMNPRA